MGRQSRDAQDTHETQDQSVGQLARLVKGGAIWIAVDRGAVQFMNLLSSMILARLLAPSDFGIMGVVVLFTGLSSRVIQFGFGAAVIRRETVRPDHLAALLLLTLCTNGAVCLVLIGAAPYIGAYFKNALVGQVLAVMAVIFLLRVLGACPSVMLRHSLNTRAFTISSILDYAVRLSVTIVLAVAGFGVWSLAWGRLVGGVADKLYMIRASGWRPSFRTSRSAIRDLFGFGVRMNARDTLAHLAANADNFVVGKWLGMAPLGFYEKAYRLMDLPVKELSGRMNALLFPAFAKIYRDSGRLRAAFRKSLLWFSVLAYPVFGSLVVLAPQIIPLIYGARWTPTIVPFQILCLAGPARILSGASVSVVEAAGAIGSEAWRRAVGLALLVLGCIVGSHWEVNGVAWAVVAANFVLTGMMLQLLSTASAVSLRDVWNPLRIPLLATLAMMAVERGCQIWTAPTSEWAAIGTLAVSAAAGGVTYLLVLYVLRDKALDRAFAELRRDLHPLIDRGRLARAK